MNNERELYNRLTMNKAQSPFPLLTLNRAIKNMTLGLGVLTMYTKQENQKIKQYALFFTYYELFCFGCGSIIVKKR